MEFNPRQDVGYLTENLAAKLAKEIAARCSKSGQAPDKQLWNNNEPSTQRNDLQIRNQILFLLD